MSSKAELIAKAVEIALDISIDAYKDSQFDNQARKTGFLIHSSDCSIKIVGNTVWYDGRVAVTSNVIIVRSAHRILGSLYSSISLNIPITGFSFANNTGNDIVFIPHEAVRFNYLNKKYEMIRMNRKKFTDAIGAARKY